MAIWPYSHMAIMANNGGNMGVFRKRQSKCCNMVKTVSQIDHLASKESKNGPVAYFPLYF
jgi:hypothetical protein